MLDEIKKNGSYYCLRHQYTCPNFDRSIIESSYEEIKKKNYFPDFNFYLDDDGRQWVTKELTTKHLLNYFLSNPECYFNIIQERTNDFVSIRKLVEYAHDIILRNDSNGYYLAIEKLIEAYVAALKYIHVGQLIVEGLYDAFSSTLEKVLPNKRKNIFISSILTSTSTVEAIRNDFFEDTRGTKRIDAVNSGPVCIFADQQKFNYTYEDQYMHDLVSKSDINLWDYMVMRNMLPTAVAIAEEFRYADYSIRTNLKYLLTKIKNSSNVNPYLLTSEKLLEFVKNEKFKF